MSDVQTVAGRLQKATEDSRRSIRSLQQELHTQGVRGSSYASVHSYFKGPTEPPLHFLRSAAKALGVREAWLATGEGEQTETAQQIAEATSGREVSPNEAEARAHLARLLERAFPEYKDFPPSVSEAVKDAWMCYAAGVPSGRVLSARDLANFLADIRQFLMAPAWNWGLRHDLNDREFAVYALGMLSAIIGVMPAPGAGDSLDSYRPNRAPGQAVDGEPLGRDGEPPMPRPRRGRKKRSKGTKAPSKSRKKVSK
jgi:hypothetical protein